MLLEWKLSEKSYEVLLTQADFEESMKVLSEVEPMI